MTSTQKSKKQDEGQAKSEMKVGKESLGRKAGPAKVSGFASSRKKGETP